MQRVLIVEDEVMVALELESILEDLGHQVVGIAADADIALRLAQDRPDVALVDLNLRDGLTGASLGQQLAGEYGVKVVFLTANPSLLSSGVPGTVGVVPKPYDAEQVENVLEYVTGHVPAPPPAFVLFEQRA